MDKYGQFIPNHGKTSLLACQLETLSWIIPTKIVTPDYDCGEVTFFGRGAEDRWGILSVPRAGSCRVSAEKEYICPSQDTGFVERMLESSILYFHNAGCCSSCFGGCGR
jgi:hypothetical protein